MKNSGQQVHRSGPLKQENKPHKVGRHRSNRSISAENKGKKLDVKSITKRKVDLKRHERRNQMQQIRKQKREETIMTKRSLGRESTPPILIAVLDLNSHHNENAQQLIQLISSCDESATAIHDRNYHICIPRFKLRYEFILLDKSHLFAALDAVKIADVLLLIHSHQEDHYEHLMDAIYSHCLPTTVHAVNGLEDLPNKKQIDVKKLIQKKIELKFPDEKLRSVQSHSDALQLMNQIGSCKKKKIAFRVHRSQILAEKIQFECDSNEENAFGTLKVYGFVRNCPFDVNSIAHIPGWGDFQMSLIEASPDPYPLVLKQKNNESNFEPRIIQKADPKIQQILESENVPDPMEGEQTWPTAEELEAAKNERKIVKNVPKGTSDYQAAWIFDDEDNQDDNEEDDDDESDSEVESEDENDEMEVQDESISDEEKETDKDEDDDIETMTITEGDDVKYDEKLDLNEEQENLKKFREQKQDEMFPDEVDTPIDVKAKIRFARYRGLKSFRTSPWDPKENLPSDYSKIFQFENFQRTKNRVFKEEQSGAQPGWFVIVHVNRVPKKLYDEYLPHKNPLVIFNLLPHEQRMSVLNLVIKKHHSCEEVIKSKEKLIFHVGCRRFSASPIFSAHTNGNKHKLERFLRNDCPVVATIYAPITFPPASVLVYKQDQKGNHNLIATGFLMSCDPDRVIIKRIVLSGHPFKINKKSAVIRYMFFNREDILWFKPVELRTKYGRRGHIKEPLGTHGHMKCTFEKQLRADDTVLMNLYKRAYPKWNYDPHVNPPTNQLNLEEEMNLDEQIDEIE